MRYKDKRVLVVDQDSLYRQEVCDELERVGFDRSEMFCVDNVHEANELLEAGQAIDVIFLEVKGTADPDGYSVCAFVKMARERYDIPIFLTFIGRLGPFRDASIYSQGFIEKPINKEKLLTKVRRIMKIARLEDRINSLRVPDEGDFCGRD